MAILSYPMTHPDDSDVDAKNRGAYYTDFPVAKFLAKWSIRSPADRILDPSFGGGVFLRAAGERLTSIGPCRNYELFGVEIDPFTHATVSANVCSEFKVRATNLIRGDFFELSPSEMGGFDAVIGNPPFIRYQRFRGEARQLGLKRCREQGVSLPELCSSWAPFLVHSIAFLNEGGRLAMVAPKELVHAKYALPVLDHLRQRFHRVTVLTFDEPIFANLNEETVLILCDGKGRRAKRFDWLNIASSEALVDMALGPKYSIRDARSVDADEIASGSIRLVEYAIPEKARLLYRRLRATGAARPFGSIADVGIGYVTGANDFFHVSPKQAADYKIPASLLKPIVRRGRGLQGLRFTRSDWVAATNQDEGGFLVHLPKTGKLPASVVRYLEEGESRGVANAYKCRVRSPWYSVPHVRSPDAFLTYMSGRAPRFVSNEAGAFAPNSLHLVQFHPLFGTNPLVAALLWQTSLTQLSVEIEGHALGGGMLKLEPTEAGNVLVPAINPASQPRLQVACEEVDALLRRGDEKSAQERADRLVLEQIVGLTSSDCRSLRLAAERLRGRRGY